MIAPFRFRRTASFPHYVYFIIFAIALLLTGCRSGEPGLKEQPGGAELESSQAGWRMAGGNPQRTGQSGAIGPSAPTLAWEQSLEPRASDYAVAVGADGTAFIRGAVLQAVNSNGSLKWRRKWLRSTGSSAYYQTNGITPISNGGLACLDYLGDEHPIGDELRQYRLSLLDPSGQEIAFFDYMGHIPKDFVSTLDGGVIWADQDQNGWVVRRLSNLGELDLELALDTYLPPTVAVDNQGGFYIFTYEQVAAYDAQGQLRWVYDDTAPASNFSIFVVGPDNNLYIKTDSGQKDEGGSSEQRVHYYYVITPSGNRQAMIELADYEKSSISEPYRQMWAVSTAGAVFVVHPQGQVAAYDALNGAQLWVNDTIRWQPRSYTADPVSGDLAITGNAAEFGSDDYWPSAARIDANGQYLWTRRNIKAIHGFTQDSLTIATGTRDQLVAISPQGETAWERPLGGEINFTLAAASGEIYVAQRNQLYVLDSNGSIAWNYSFDDPEQILHSDIEELCLGRNGMALFIPESRSSLWALDSRGNTLWQFTPSSSSANDVQGVLPMDNGDILVQSDSVNLHRLSPAGGVVWSTGPVPWEHRALATGLDGSVFCAYGTVAQCLDLAGVQRWQIERFHADDNADTFPGPVVAADGSAYYAAGHSTYQVSPEGAVVRQYRHPDHEQSIAMALATDGTLYVQGRKAYESAALAESHEPPRDTTQQITNGSLSLSQTTGYDLNLIAFHPDTSVKWERSLPWNGFYTRDIIVDRLGRLYLCIRDHVYCIDTAGQIVWEYDVAPLVDADYPDCGAPALTPDGLLIVSYAENVFAFGP